MEGLNLLEMSTVNTQSNRGHRYRLEDILAVIN
jgi:hypothetical protein